MTGDSTGGNSLNLEPHLGLSAFLLKEILCAYRASESVFSLNITECDATRDPKSLQKGTEAALARLLEGNSLQQLCGTDAKVSKQLASQT